jgi:orotate phosphoribosyltransferase
MHWLQRENNPHRQTAITFSYLGKIGLSNCWDLQECKNHLQSLLFQSILQNSVSEYPLIVGLTESGIVPSALMHQNAREQGINAQWLCSTRRPAAGICFTESHSHGPNHILPLPQYQPTELWFVEDEITTGRTILNLALRLCPLTNVKYIRLFALADTRTRSQISQFNSIAANYGIRCSTHALINAESPIHTENQDLLLPVAETLISNLVRQNNCDWHFARQRAALQSQFDTQIELPQNLAGSLLVIGEAIDIGLRVVQNNPSLFLQHVTLSPWKVDGKTIFSRQDICRKYYFYNYEQIQPPVYILSDPIDQEIELELKHMLTQKGVKVDHLQLQSLAVAG